MKKNASTATKAATKSLPATKKKAAKKPGRGGARPGAGRKATRGETQQIHVDMPIEVLKAMEAVKVENKTAFMIYAASKILSTMKLSAKAKKELQTIITNSSLHF